MTIPRYLASRRKLLASAAGLAAIGSLASMCAAATLPATPWQTPGPFYPKDLPLDSDTDLVKVAGRSEPAEGVVTHIFGRVLGPAGEPLKGAHVEIWQCDNRGFYHHPGDRGGKADPNFQGYGRMTLGTEGVYHFRTIKPVAYPGRTPHIHFAVIGPGLRPFTTQMYVAGEPQNERDFLYRRLSSQAVRQRSTVALNPAPELEASALVGRFEIVVGSDFISG